MFVREMKVCYRTTRRRMPPGNLGTSARAAELAVRLIGNETREVMIALMLDAHHQLLGYRVVSAGGVRSTAIDPKEVFKAALLVNAVGVILAHNHPSGRVTPSNEDIETTKRLADGGKLLNIEVLDHVIVSHDGRHHSLRADGVFE